MALKIPLRSAWLWLRRSPLVEGLVAEHGPSARRVPRLLRKRIVRQSDIAALPHTQAWRLTTQLAPQPVPSSPLRRPLRGTAPPFVARIEGAWLVGRHATPWTLQGRMLLSPFLNQLPLLGADEHADLVRWAQCQSWSREPSGEENAWAGEEVCSLVGRLDVNYYHWIVDICGQLEALAAYRECVGEKAKILIRAHCPAFMRQSLQMLGYGPSRLLEWPLAWAPGQRALHLQGGSECVPTARRVGRLVVPSWHDQTREHPPRSLLWLRRAFFKACGIDVSADGSNVEQSGEAEGCDGKGCEGRKVYLHRARGGWRYVENEDEVCAFLESRGFEILRPEMLSVAEQVRICSRARVLVGMHGAGLTNLLWAPRASLIELCGSYGGSDYVRLARSLGNPYKRVACETQGDNIVVNLRELGYALESVV